MKKNAFTNIILNWEKWNVAQKLKGLQALENLNAKRENRNARKVVFRPELASNPIFKGRSPAAFYNRREPEYITFLELGFSDIESIYFMMHEAEHGLVDDYVNDRNDLHVLGNIDKEKVKLEFECLSEIGSLCDESLLFQRLFDQKYAEEQLAIHEPIYKIVRWISESIDSPKDMKNFATLLCLLCYIKYDREHEARRIEKELCGTYEEIISPILEKQTQKSAKERKEDLDTSKKIVSGTDTFYQQAYKGLYDKYKIWAQSRDSVFVAESIKQKNQNEVFDAMMNYLYACLNKNQLGGE